MHQYCASDPPTISTRAIVRGAAVWCILAAAGLLPVVHAYTVTITSATKNLYLQIGQGAITPVGGTAVGGATPTTNTTVDRVGVSIPAASVGTGALPMTPNVAVTSSFVDGSTYCLATDTYVGGMYRGPITAIATAILTVATPATALVNGTGDTISFSTISWQTQLRPGDSAANTLPSGVFLGDGTTQSVWTINRNTWAESCLQFKYSNALVVPAGTYNGRVVYTLSAP